MTPDSETWHPVVGLDGRYEVSDQGRVRSVDRWIHDSNGRRTRWRRGKTLTPWVSSGYGYLAVGLPRGVSVSRLVHRLVAEAFLGPCPPGLEVLHGPGGHLDNSVGNLRYGTHTENILDTNRDGTNWHRNRERCPRSHPLQPPNLVPSVAKRGHRDCLACARARATVRSARDRHGIELDLIAEADRHYRQIASASAASAVAAPGRRA